MKHATADLEVVPHAPIVVDGVQHPASLFDRWTREEKAALGIYEVERDEVPEGKVATGWSLQMADGYVREVPELVDYVPPVPTQVSMRQARLALSRAGRLADAENAIAAMDGQAGEEARIEWEYATSLRRDHPLVDGLGASLNLDHAALDDLFREAAQIG